MFSSDLQNPAPLFAITINTGDYDDKDTCIVGVTHDEAAAQEYVDRMNALAGSVYAKRSAQQTYLIEWQKNHPQPRPFSRQIELLPVPKLPSNRAPTPEERAAKAAAQDENSTRTAKANEPFVAWFQEHQAASAQWERENLASEELDVKKLSHPSWSVEPVQWFVPPVTVPSLIPQRMCSTERPTRNLCIADPAATG